MDAPISHNSAARFWLAYGAPGVPRVVGSSREMTPAMKVPSAAALDKALSFGFLPEPIHCLVSKASSRYRKQGVKAHSCIVDLPAGSILFLDNGLSVCSPKLTFVQMGCVLPVPLLALLGMQLCGVHAIDPHRSKDGDLGSGGQGGCLSGLPARSQLTGCDRLDSFVRSTRLAGSRKAASALKLMVDRSRSPMESATALLFAAPLRMGGFSLGRPELNRRVALPQWLHAGEGHAARRFGNEPYAETDIVLSNNGREVHVDYHGEWAHTGEGNVHHDSLKANAFKELGMDYFTLTKWQFYNLDLLDKIVCQLRSALRLHPRVRVEGYEARKRALHRTVSDAVRAGFFDALG